MTIKEEEKAIQEDNKYFMDDDNKKGYLIDAFVVLAVIFLSLLIFLWEINQ